MRRGESGREQRGESGVGVGRIDLDDGSGAGASGWTMRTARTGSPLDSLAAAAWTILRSCSPGCVAGVRDVGEVDVVFGAQGERVTDALPWRGG